MKYLIAIAAGVVAGSLLYIIQQYTQPSQRPFNCSHEYSYFKSDEVFVITQVPALNECKE